MGSNGSKALDLAARPASPLTKRQAQKLTDRIAQTVEGLWSLLAEAHDLRAWAPLGYVSWDDYVTQEFGMSRSNSYRLLDQGRVIASLAEAAGVSRARDMEPAVSARDAEAVKPVLAKVAERVRRQVKAEPEKRPEVVVGEVVKQVRQERQPAPRPSPVAKPETPVYEQQALGFDDALAPHLDAIDRAALAANKTRGEWVAWCVRSELARLSPRMRGATARVGQVNLKVKK